MIGWSAGLNLRNDGGAGIPAGKQRHHRRDRRLDVDGGAVDVAVQIELQRHVRAARRARRGHLVDAGDRRELALERARHGRRHRRRVAAGQAGADVQRREIDVGKIADRQHAVRDDAHHRDAEHEEARGNRAPDEDFRDVHSIDRITARDRSREVFP